MDTYTAALKSARKELSRLASERERIDRRIALVKQLIEAMIPFIESEKLAAETTRMLYARDDQSETGVVIVNEGITDAIRRVFTLDHLLTPTEVRDQLEIMGFDLSKHSNPMATIHSVLKRLVEQGWLKPSTKDDKPAYMKELRTYNDWREEVMQLAIQITDPMAKVGAQARELSEQMTNSARTTGKAISKAMKEIKNVSEGMRQQNMAVVDAFSGKGSLPQKALKEKKD